MKDKPLAGTDFLIMMLVVLLIVSAFLAIEPIGEPVKKFLVPEGKSWLDLVGAVGTWAAVAAALLIANRGEQRNARGNMQRARLVAAEISVRLMETTHQLGQLDEMFALDEVTLPDMRSNLQLLVQFLSVGSLFLPRETLMDLIPLPDEAAHRIARAQDLLRLVKRDIERRPATIKEGSQGAVSALHARAGDTVRQAHRELVMATSECIEAAHLETPAISELGH